MARKSASLPPKRRTNKTSTQTQPCTSYKIRKRNSIAFPSPSESLSTTSIQDKSNSPSSYPVALLEFVDAHIDWNTPGEFTSCIPLEECRTVDELFASIVSQASPAIQQRAIIAVKVEHVNYEPDGKSACCRIVRAGTGGLKTYQYLLRRLQELDGETDPELKFMVEWA